MLRTLTVIAFGWLTGNALGQVTPDRVYYGVDRPIPLTVVMPRAALVDPVAKPRLELQLLAADKAEPLDKASVLAGKVDAAALFPTLWKDKPRKALFVQLMVEGRASGPAVVLLPMINPLRARSVPPAVGEGKRPKIVFEALKDEEDVYSGVRAYVDQRIVLTTDVDPKIGGGEIEIALRPDAAPNTAWNFLDLVKGGFYTGISFHRVVPLNRDGQPFVIQAGDPTATGSGGCGYYFDLEPGTLKHDLGVVSMARAEDPDTNGSQFFVCLSREGTARLDNNYTAFAVVTRGLEVVQEIARTPLDAGSPGKDKPIKAPVIVSATTVDAPPMKAGAPPLVQELKGSGKGGNPER